MDAQHHSLVIVLSHRLPQHSKYNNYNYYYNYYYCYNYNIASATVTNGRSTSVASESVLS